MRIKQVAIFDDDLPADERQQRDVNRQRDERRGRGGQRQVGRQIFEIVPPQPDDRRDNGAGGGQRELLFGYRGQADQNAGGDQLPPPLVFGVAKGQQQGPEREDHRVRSEERRVGTGGRSGGT